MCISARRRLAFRRFVKALQSQHRRGLRAISPRRQPRHQAAARIARESACTASTSAATFSGGVAGTMPWPRLKMWPGAGPAARTIADGFARDGRGIGQQHQRIEIALQRDARADRARAPRRGRRSSRGRRRARRMRRSRRATAPPPLVNTIVGIATPSRAGASASSTVAHRAPARSARYASVVSRPPQVSNSITRVGARARSARRGTRRPRAR